MPPSWSNLAARRCMRDVKEHAPEENQAPDLEDDNDGAH